MNEQLQALMRGWHAVDPSNDELFAVGPVIECWEGNTGKQTRVLLSSYEDGEVRLEQLVDLRDSEFYRLFKDKASAEAYVKGQEGEAE